MYKSTHCPFENRHSLPFLIHQACLKTWKHFFLVCHFVVRRFKPKTYTPHTDITQTACSLYSSEIIDARCWMIYMYMSHTACSLYSSEIIDARCWMIHMVYVTRYDTAISIHYLRMKRFFRSDGRLIVIVFDPQLDRKSADGDFLLLGPWRSGKQQLWIHYKLP